MIHRSGAPVYHPAYFWTRKFTLTISVRSESALRRRARHARPPRHPRETAMPAPAMIIAIPTKRLSPTKTRREAMSPPMSAPTQA